MGGHMRRSFEQARSQALGRVGVVALLAGLGAGCSADTARLSGGNPFSNPFGRPDPVQTGSLPPKPARPVQSAPLAAPVTAPAVVSRPLPPPAEIAALPPATPS